MGGVGESGGVRAGASVPSECSFNVGLASVATVLAGSVQAVYARAGQIAQEFPVQAYGTQLVDVRIIGGGPDWDGPAGGLAFCSLLRSRSAD